MTKNLENPNELQESSFKQELWTLKKEISEDPVPKEIRDFLNKTKEKKSLTDEEFKKYIKYVKEYKRWCDLPNLTRVTDYQVKEIVDNQLSVWISYIEFVNLTSITDKQAMELSRLKDVRLNWLTNITDKQAEFLWRVPRLYLDKLWKLTDKQAEYLSKVKNLSLAWLSNITDKQAESLSKVEWLFMNGNEDVLTPKQKKIIFGKHNHFNWAIRNSY